MEFRLLGSLEAAHDGEALPLGGPKQRAVLAILLLNANELVSRDRLVAELWDGRQPESAAHTVEVYVSRLRKSLRRVPGGEDILVTPAGGYMARVTGDQLDVRRFERLAENGRRALAAGEPERAAATLRAALALWRGPAIADLANEPFARVEAERLEELRRGAVEDRIDAELGAGRHRELVPELERLVEHHPFRERLLGQLMTALYRSGRQAEALAAYASARRRFADELGLEPGRAVQELQVGILRQDPGLELAATNGDGPAHALVAPAPPTSRRRRLRLPAAALALAIVAAVAVLTSFRSTAASGTVAAGSVGVVSSDGSVRSLARLPRVSAVAAGAGYLWATDASSGQLLQIDPGRGVVDRVPVGEAPSALAVEGGDVWVADAHGGSVARVSVARGLVVARVPTGVEPSAVGVGAGAVWVANAVDGTVTRIDPRSGRRVATIHAGESLSGLVASESAVWASSPSTGLLLRIDPSTDRVVQVVDVGVGVGALALTSSGLWAANPEEGTVARVDPATGAVRKLALRGASALAAGGGSVWAASDAGALYRIGRAARVSRVAGLAGPPVALASLRGSVAAATLPRPEGHLGGTLRAVAKGGAVYSLDPGLAWDLVGWQILSVTNDGLVTYRRAPGAAGAQIVPDLAASLPVVSDGGRTYTFRLRPGMRYSTGRPVRASDFRRAAERMWRAPSALAILGVPLLGARSCTSAHCDLSRGVVTDDRRGTVVYRLERPFPALLGELALPFGAPVPPGAPAFGRGIVPGTGPYVIADGKPRIVLERNRRFKPWSADAQPPGIPDRIVVALGGRTDALASDVLAGRADVLLGEPRIQRAGLLGTAQAHPHPSSFELGLFLNSRLPPFSSRDVRRALNLAVDRRAVVRALGGPQLAKPLCQVLPPDFPGHRPFCRYTARPDATGLWHGPALGEARRLVARSGTRGERVRVSAPRDDPTSLAAARSAVRTLRLLGYRSSLRLYPDGHTYYERVGRRSARSQIGVLGWGPDYLGASSFFVPLFTCRAYRPDVDGNMNPGGFCDHRLDRAIDRASRLEPTRPALAVAAWQRIDRALAARAAWAPLVSWSALDLTSRRVGGYTWHPRFGALLDRLWVR